MALKKIANILLTTEVIVNCFPNIISSNDIPYIYHTLKSLDFSLYLLNNNRRLFKFENIHKHML